MNPEEPPAPPPEARLIRIAREAAGMTMAAAARGTQGVVSIPWWRDIERGYGGRRGVRVPARASDRTLAHMAKVVGMDPERLEAARRAGAAEVLRGIRGIYAVDGAGDPDEIGLALLAAEHPDDRILQMIAVRGGASAATRLREARGWLGVQADLRNGTDG